MVSADAARLSLVQDQLPESPRIVPIDNLKAILVAWIIAGHAMLGYAAIGGWPYDEVSEATLPPQLELVLASLVGPTALFVIGTFFFLSGLFAPGNITRDGPGEFLRQRLVRLGLPWLVFTLLIWPVLMWFAYRSAGHQIPIWEALQARQPFLDSGPLWFVQILLYVSVFHALFARRGYGRELRPRTISLTLTAACIAAASFAIRLWYPARSQQVLDLHVWQWPQCVGLYVLGVLVADQGWAERVPPHLGRRCGVAVLGTIAVALVIMVATGVANLSRDDILFLGGWHWQALTLDVVEATLVVAGSVWLLALAQRWLTHRAAGLTHWARGAYLAYLLQAPVLIGLEIAERSLPWPAVIKAVTVAVLAVVGSFTLGWLLIKRTRLGRTS
jgi:hypothetical protein